MTTEGCPPSAYRDPGPEWLEATDAEEEDWAVARVDRQNRVRDRRRSPVAAPYPSPRLMSENSCTKIQNVRGDSFEENLAAQTRNGYISVLIRTRKRKSWL